MLEIAPGWQADVDRGPDWLFVKFRNPGQDASPPATMAERFWELLQQHGVYRLILEMDQIEVLYSFLIGQLVLLHKRISVQGGLMRLCGLSPHNRQVLELCRLDDRFYPYRNREEAVLGHRNS